jgi:PKD repeat protein
LPDPVVVEVTDSTGAAVAGATVAFQLTEAGTGAEMIPASATTDAAGNAQARIHLGDKVGVQTGEARVVAHGAAIPATSFTATARSDHPANRPPTADFHWFCDNLSCQFTDASTDSDGQVSKWDWDFGDGATSNVMQPAHVYSEPGTYSVTLTATDDGGLSDATSAGVEVQGPPAPPNEAPHADFEVHCARLTCAFVDKSTDKDGTITDWFWSFGDGFSSNQRNPLHSYEHKAKFDVLLTVTDNMGAAGTTSRRVDVKD